MSRKSKTPIALPKGVEVSLKDGTAFIKGPKGNLEQKIPAEIKLETAENFVTVSASGSQESTKGFLGLYWALINNMVIGVTTGFKKDLQLIGVGYRAAVQGKSLNLQLGFSHPTAVPIPDGIEVKIEKGTQVAVIGANSQMVGQFAAQVRALRKPEPYKGKGIHYVGEYVRRKAGKTAKAR